MADGISSFVDIAKKLLPFIAEWKDKAINFKKDFERLQTTLASVVPQFEEGRRLDLELDDRNRNELDKLIEKLRKGQELVKKCCNVRWWNLYKKILYSGKITDLDKAIFRFCQLELQAEMFRDQKQLRVENKQLLLNNKQLESQVEALSQMMRHSQQMMCDFQQSLSKVEGLIRHQGGSMGEGSSSVGNVGVGLFPAKKLLDVILEMKDKAFNFREDLERLQNTLQRVVPLFEEGRLLDLESNDRKTKGLERFIGKLRKGEEMVQKCCKVSSFNIFPKIRYSSKIHNLNETILNFYWQELHVDPWYEREKQVLDIQIQQLLRKLKEMTLQQERTVGRINIAVPELPDRVVGFDLSLREFKFELLKENVTVLGLCAPVGCGKSTLAAMLCGDEQIRGIFRDKIFFVTVKKTATTLEILKRLIEEIGGEVPHSNLSEEDATKQFRQLLEQSSEPVMLVLDGVWDETIIKKFFSETKGYKILVTSRKVFKTYDSKHHSKHILKTLSHQDSMTLFRQIALPQDGNEDFEPDEDLLNEIVKCCDGFPFAIMVIATSLNQQPAEKWENMARKLLEGSSILDFDEKLRNCLASSLDSLDDTVRECFMDLGSFPEDSRIPFSALFDIWSELYDLEDENAAFVNLLELASRNLISLVGSRNSAKEIDELFITQHDLLRDLAIYQSRQERKRIVMDTRQEGIPENWREQENHYLNARLVSLCTGEMCPESWYDLQLPGAEVLILNFSGSNYAIPPFVQKMRKLKVLVIVNSGLTHAELGNLKTLTDLANLKRIRLAKVSIPPLHELTMPLMNLQKISLNMCSFGQSLMKCTIDVAYLLPNLVEIDISYSNDLVELPPWICDIINLQKLSITYCPKLSALPERIGFIPDLEFLRLHACHGLPELPDSIKGLRKLRSFDISDCQDLKMLPDGLGELHCLEKLDMRGCIDLKTLPSSAMKLVHLKEVLCDEDKVSLWEPLSPSLKIIVLREEHNLDWLGVDL
ncbi:putative disease resistance protein At5g47280 [Telopea speciosissima]|uniref:putative disease resistance protein At5g47280 n=1 Tax=Telopea speciosissima TaxID=54955 RepID=UPI001CC478F4|nr:putative disease resistance protein At5g47280 [Telopea speciosissima]